MTRDQIVNRVQGIREKLKAHYIEQIAFTQTIVKIVVNTETDRMIKLAFFMNQANVLAYTSLMKTGTLLGYGGEESPYPGDNSAEVGPIQIPEFFNFLVSANPAEARPEDVDLAIGGTKALRIQLQELITDLDSFRVSEVVNRSFVRLYDALTVELITAKHYLGLLLNELNKLVEFQERGKVEGAKLPEVPFGDDFEKEKVMKGLADSASNFKMEEDKITDDMYRDNVESNLATNFKMESDDVADGFNIIDGRANPDEAIDKNE